MRKFTMPFSVSFTNVGEIMNLQPAVGHSIQIKRVVCGNGNFAALPAQQMFQIRAQTWTGATAGTGGGGATIIMKTDPADAAPLTTGLTGATTPTSGVDAQTQPYEQSAYIYQGLDSPMPGDGLVCAAPSSAPGSAECFSLSLISVPLGSVSITLAGFVEFWEF